MKVFMSVLQGQPVRTRSGQNRLLPHITWHWTLEHSGDSWFAGVRRHGHPLRSELCSQAHSKERQLRTAEKQPVKYNMGMLFHVLCRVEVPDPKIQKPQLPFWEICTQTSHFSLWALHLSRCALCPEVKHMCMECRDGVLSTNLLWRK